MDCFTNRFSCNFKKKKKNMYNKIYLKHTVTT